ncbi:MAG: formylglycine-generating enzyme family protein [Acidobacteriota bacterium]
MKIVIQKIRQVLVIIVLFTLLTGSVPGQQGDGRIFTNPSHPTPHKRVPPKRPPVTKPVERKPAEKPVIPSITRIPGGSFEMGSINNRPSEAPVHTVELDSFEIGIYEITNEEFESFVKLAKYYTDAERQNSQITWRSLYQPGRENYPVVLVSWYDAVKYCNWLSEVTGDYYRLPTEAEWEYAARGKFTGKSYPWGDEMNTEMANYDAETDSERASFVELPLEFIHSVGSYFPNGYGLYDVTGNVWEWCQDWYHENYYQISPKARPQGPEQGSYKVMRGGSWINNADYCRVSFRNFNTPSYNNIPNVGFRVVKVAR